LRLVLEYSTYKQTDARAHTHISDNHIISHFIPRQYFKDSCDLFLL